MIDIFKKYLKKLKIESVIITNKLLTFKKDYLIIHNITRAIYQCQEKLYLIEKFQFIEPITKLFHLQINVLILFISIIQGKKDNQVSFTYFQEIILQKTVTQNAKDLYISNNFFQIIVTRFVLALCMQDTLYSEISEFKTWLSKNNQSKIVENIEDKYLNLFKIIQLWTNTIK